MKKIFLVSLMFSIVLLSNDLFDISHVKFGSYKFTTDTKMRIYKTKFAAFNLPIKINCHSEALEKTKTGYLRKSTVIISFTAIKSNKMSIKTERITEFDAHRQLSKLSEKITRNNEVQQVTCTPLREELRNKGYKKEIGYKSDVVLLNCDDGNQMKMQSKLQKSPTKGLANFTTKKNFMMKYDEVSYKIEEKRTMTIDKSGIIKKITCNAKVKNLFSIKYVEKDIVNLTPLPSI